MQADRIPRIMVAAPASGHGKTTLATGLMAALCRRGTEVAPFKVGPDYIDPGYHQLATSRLGRNLDPNLCSPELIVPLLKHGFVTPRPAALAVIEGVMGLFDGKLGSEGFGSSAHVATMTKTPVILCVDVSHTSRTIGAWVHGLATYDLDVNIAGVVVNKVGSPRHLAEVRAGIERTGIPVLGALPRDAEITAPERHLGLVPVAERNDAVRGLDRLADHVGSHIDLDAVSAIAHAAPGLPGNAWNPGNHVHAPGPEHPVVAIAGGRAFTFNYAETAELLTAGGCRIEIIDPLNDRSLPPHIGGLYLGGGFPEMHAADLSANESLRHEIAYAARRGLPIVAECAGLLYLANAIDGTPMSAVVPVEAGMSPRLTMGYRSAVAPEDTLIARRGDRVTGHEFHRTTLTSPYAADGLAPAWRIGDAPEGVSLDPGGRGVPTVHASYLHTHWAGHPGLAQRFVEAVHAFAGEVSHES